MDGSKGVRVRTASSIDTYWMSSKISSVCFGTLFNRFSDGSFVEMICISEVITTNMFGFVSLVIEGVK